MAKGEQRNKSDHKMLRLFHYYVVQIQRSLRGWYSRRKRANHADRKRAIAQILENGARVREMMYEYSTQQALREEQEVQEKKEKEFKMYAENLHHLVSTKHIRGVFNPPSEYLEVPTWKEMPVEDHVRGAIRDLLRTRGVPKSGLVPDLHGSRKIPLRGRKNLLSVQASAPYDSLQREKSKTLMLHKILTADKGYWFAGGKTRIIDHDEVPLSIGDPYVDQNMNPLLKKGVPKNQQQLLESARLQKALFIPPLERPFYPRSGGNRSHVQPNDLFDVIGDAEETGGVTERRLGVTSRFGVPESCDYRPPGGVLPSPPARARTLKTTRPRVSTYSIRVKPMAQADPKATITNATRFDGEEGEEGETQGIVDPWASSDEEEEAAV